MELKLPHINAEAEADVDDGQRSLVSDDCDDSINFTSYHCYIKR